MLGGNYNTGAKASGFRDVQTAFTFQQGSLDGEIIGYTGVNTFNFMGNNVGITGKVSAHNGYDWESGSVGAGSANQYYGAINKINFTGTGTATIGGDITALETSQNIITFAGTTQGFINGNIASGYYDFTTVNANQNNFIVFKGTSGQIGSNSSKVNLTIDNRNAGNRNGTEDARYRFSNNVILFNAKTSNSLYLSTLSAKGDPDPSGNTARETFNLLDFSGSNNTATIDAISVNRGMTIIGANLVKDSSVNGFTLQLDEKYGNSPFYNESLFEKVTHRMGGNSQATAIRMISNFAQEFAKDTYRASGTYTIGSIITERGSSANYINVENLNVTGNIIARTDQAAGVAGKNYIFANGISNITGNIQSTTSNMNGNQYNNTIVLNGTSSALGNSANAISISISNNNSSGTLGGKYSNNSILLGADTNALNISSLSVSGDGGSNDPVSKTFNLLSLNSASGNGNKTIQSITSSSGSNIVGKDLIKTETDTSNNVSLDSVIFYNANLFEQQTGTFGSAKSTGIGIKSEFATAFMTDTYTAKGSITIGTDNTQDAITASSGGNYINMENIAIVGNVKASGGNNYIYSTGTLSLGTSDGAISITAQNSGVSNNITANTLNANIGNLTTSSAWHANGSNNIIQMTTGNIVINNMSAQYANNTSENQLTITGGDANSSLRINSIYSNARGVNTINSTAKTNTIGIITANTDNAGVGTNNISFSTTMQVNGNISKAGQGQNNFTFTADGGTLTLKGQTNQISTLTALSGASTGDTLIIDGTTNANNTTIDTLTNGDSLIVNFNGQGENNGATLNLKSTPTLKQVIVNNNSTNNTLDLTQTTKTTINTKIAIADTQQLAINLSDTELALDTTDNNLGLTTTGTGISTINVSNTGTLSGGDIVATNLNMTGSTATTTFKNANTTFNTLTASATTNNLTLDVGSSAVTIGSTDSTFNATFAGTVSQTLAINGGTNTISTLALGTLTTPDSTTDTLSIGGGSTTIASAITSDTNNNLTLQIGSSDSSKSASLTLSGAITTANTQSGTDGVANVIFTGSTTASSNLATLTLKGSSNTLTGVTTQTANALIEVGANTLSLGTLTFSGANGTQSLQINGGENTITSLALNNTAGVQNILTQNAGNTTIESAISVGANQNLTLKIGSNIEPEKPRSSSIVLSEALTITDSTSGVANLVFEGGSSPSQTNHYSALVLTKGTSQFSSIDSKSSNAMLILKNSDLGTPSVSVSSQITIEKDKSLTIGFLGDGNSTATASQGIVVKDGGTLGIAIGGASGNKKIDISNYNFDDVFQKGSTLRIDFLENSGSTGIIGNGNAISIKDGRKSMINFYGGSGNPSLKGGISLDGGENEVNFYGSATLGNITLNSGTNTIRVKRDLTGFTATITNVNATNGTGLGGVTNYIYLEENATLKLGASGTDSLTSTTSATPSTLNFIGTGATLQGGFGASGGSAIINVGLDEFYDADKGTEFIGTITGAVTNASLNFNAGTSKLTLQSQTNTFTEINSQAKDGVLVLDTTSNQVDATISGATTIASNKSLSFDFKGDQNSTITTTGGLVIDGTLGVIISGSGDKKVEGDINLNGRGTLYVNYAGGDATVTLGDGDGITIGKGESSIIDFNSTNGTLANTLTLDGGSNTINFNQNASLDKITLTSGNNTFNVADGKTATIGDTSAVGGVHNTINLEANSTINLKSGSSSQDGSGSIITSLNNTLNFNGSGAKLQGSFGADKGGSASVNVAGSNSVITGSLSNASITFSSDNADLTLQSGNSTITSLTGYTAPSTYTRNGRTITRTITNTLTLDDTNDTNPISATITSAVVGDSVGLKFGDGGESKTFTFSANGNHLTGVAFGTTSTNNTLEFTNGNSTLDSVTLESGSDLTIKLGDANLTLTGGYTKGSGTSANLSVTGDAGIIANSQTINVDTLSFDNTTKASSLSVSNAGDNTFASVNATNAGTLIANDSALTITALTGDKLIAGFSGNNASRIAIQSNSDTGHSKEITLTGIVLNGATSDNTLDLTALTSTTITNNVSVGANQSLAINLGGADATLTFSNGLSGNATINANATTSNTIAGSSIALSNLNLSGTDNTTTLTTNSATINTLNANATTSNKLVLDATNNTNGVSASINSIGSTTRGVGDLDIALISGDNTTTLSLNGNTINSLDIQGDNNNLVDSARIGTLSNTSASGSLNINGGNVEVTNAIAPTSSHNMSLALNSGAKLYAVAGLNSGTDQINLTLNNSTLSLGATSTITSLSGNGGVIDFVSSGKDTSKSLTITGDCNANANVITYVSGNQANIVEANNDAGSGVLTISAVGSADEIFSITYDKDNKDNPNNVKVAQIGSSGTDKAVGGTSDIEGEIIQISLSTDGSGGYYIGSAISKGVDTSVQEVVTSALAVNYDLYLANFNSLNKRMGELRNTQESNGVWARVFGGAMSNDFGVGSKTDYITTQAGYDYSLSVGENARNFIGVAVAYGASSTKSNPSSNPNTGVLDNINSSMVEVGLYNSYVADSGWYNDTIFKFDYIMSDFTLKTGANSQQNSTSNFAMILSDEFGYRYSFGENEKGSWYIDPQAEVAFGYFNQSDFNQALNESATRTIKATQDSILTLRSRVGASLGKKFNTDKGFASLYVGAFYEYDYIEGGKSDYSLISSQGEVSNPLQSLESNGRAILNVGSNIELTKGARLYIDVEKSFGDKQRTFMQFNLGARYSF